MIKLFLSFILVCGLGLTSSEACTCVNSINEKTTKALVKKAVKSSAIVFVGKLLSRDTIKIPNDFIDYNYTRNTFIVEKVFKGKKKLDTIIILSESGKNDCGFIFFRNVEYIVYASKKSYINTDNKTEEQLTSWWTDTCKRTRIKNNEEFTILNEL